MPLFWSEALRAEVSLRAAACSLWDLLSVGPHVCSPAGRVSSWSQWNKQLAIQPRGAGLQGSQASWEMWFSWGLVHNVHCAPHGMWGLRLFGCTLVYLHPLRGFGTDFFSVAENDSCYFYTCTVPLKRPSLSCWKNNMHWQAATVVKQNQLHPRELHSSASEVICVHSHLKLPMWSQTGSRLSTFQLLSYRRSQSRDFTSWTVVKGNQHVFKWCYS